MGYLPAQVNKLCHISSGYSVSTDILKLTNALVTKAMILVYLKVNECTVYKGYDLGISLS